MAVQISGTPTVAGLFNFGVTVQDSVGEISTTQSLSVAIASPPVISLANPANGGSVWGAIDVSGYALGTASGASDPISAVNIGITSNDGSGFSSSGPAVYPNTQVARNDICGSSGHYPNAEGCP